MPGPLPPPPPVANLLNEVNDWQQPTDHPRFTIHDDEHFHISVDVTEIEPPVHKLQTTVAVMVLNRMQIPMTSLRIMWVGFAPGGTRDVVAMSELINPRRDVVPSSYQEALWTFGTHDDNPPRAIDIRISFKYRTAQDQVYNYDHQFSIPIFLDVEHKWLPREDFDGPENLPCSSTATFASDVNVKKPKNKKKKNKK